MKRKVDEVNVERGILLLDCAHEVGRTPVDKGQVGAVSEHAESPEVFCQQCNDLIFPDKMSPYLNSKTFDQHNVPKGLLNSHCTKNRTWGKIMVTNGQLVYVIDDLDNQRLVLNAGVEGIIAPKMMHHVEVSEPVEFYIEFYKRDSDGKDKS